MKLLADENLDAPIVAWLRKSGHDVAYMVEQSPGASDEDVIELAAKEQRVIITKDRDYGELVFHRGMKVAGVLYLRAIGATMAKRLDRFDTIWKAVAQNLPGHFIVAGRAAIRTRPLE